MAGSQNKCGAKSDGGNQVVGEIWILDSSSALDFSIPPPFPGAPAAGSEKNKIVQEEILSTRVRKSYFDNFLTKKHVLCPSHGLIIKRYAQLSI